MESQIPNFGLMQANLPAFHFNEFYGDSTNFQPFSCLSSNSTSDDTEKQNGGDVIDERKQRRMISNRESARRSRLRKQRQLDELWSMMTCLRHENINLVDKLNRVSECHDKVLQENTRLKGEASDLRQRLSANHLVNLEEFPAISDYFGYESVSSCEDLSLL